MTNPAAWTAAEQASKGRNFDETLAVLGRLTDDYPALLADVSDGDQVGLIAFAGRASVLIAGPLGLCYLPAFLCLGIVPVVAGLASDVLQAGLL